MQYDIDDFYKAMHKFRLYSGQRKRLKPMQFAELAGMDFMGSMKAHDQKRRRMEQRGGTDKECEFFMAQATRETVIELYATMLFLFEHLEHEEKAAIMDQAITATRRRHLHAPYGREHMMSRYRPHGYDEDDDIMAATPARPSTPATPARPSTPATPGAAPNPDEVIDQHIRTVFKELMPDLIAAVSGSAGTPSAPAPAPAPEKPEISEERMRIPLDRWDLRWCEAYLSGKPFMAAPMTPEFRQKVVDKAASLMMMMKKNY